MAAAGGAAWTAVEPLLLGAEGDAEAARAWGEAGEWEALRQRLQEAAALDASDAPPWLDSAGWAVVAEGGAHGAELKDLDARGDLHIGGNSLDFAGNGDWREQLSSPRLHMVAQDTREQAVRPASSCSAASAAATQTSSNSPLAGPGFQFARGSDGRITIGAIAPGGPANAEGSLVAGDELVSVDGLECGRAAARDVRAAILGVPGSTVRLKVFRAVERRYFDVALVRGSTEGWSLSDKLKDMEGKMKEKDSIIDLLRIQLSSALEREARTQATIIASSEAAREAKGSAKDISSARESGSSREGASRAEKVAEAALDSFFSFINPIQNSHEGGTGRQGGGGGGGGGASPAPSYGEPRFQPPVDDITRDEKAPKSKSIKHDDHGGASAAGSAEHARAAAQRELAGAEQQLREQRDKGAALQAQLAGAEQQLQEQRDKGAALQAQLAAAREQAAAAEAQVVEERERKSSTREKKRRWRSRNWGGVL